MRKTGGFGGLLKVPDAILAISALGTLAVALWLYASFGSATLRAIPSDSMYVHADFDTFWRSAEALWERTDPYFTETWRTNLNPPVWILLVSPLGLLEPLAAYRVFVLITLLTSAGSLLWMAYELRLRLWLTVVGVGMLLLSSALLDTLRLGQLYPILALGLVAAWVADRRDKPLLSGCALGLVVAVKPSLAPVILWPLVRRRWGMLGAMFASGAAATFVGLVAVGPGATLDWLWLLANTPLDVYLDNASLPAAAARLFTDNGYVEPIAPLSWAAPAADVLAGAIVILTAVKARRDSEMGLWALVAASLLISPLAWYRYLVLLGPGILLLLRRGRTAPAFLLLALQFVPREWSIPWEHGYAPAAALALTLYLYILLAHWLAFLPTGGKEPARAPEPARS